MYERPSPLGPSPMPTHAPLAPRGCFASNEGRDVTAVLAGAHCLRGPPCAFFPSATLGLIICGRCWNPPKTPPVHIQGSKRTGGPAVSVHLEETCETNSIFGMAKSSPRPALPLPPPRSPAPRLAPPTSRPGIGTPETGPWSAC